MSPQENGDEPEEMKRRSFLRATAAGATAIAGVGMASSTGSAYVPCECTDAEASQCGPNEVCVCEEIPGGLLGAGAHLGSLRATDCVNIVDTLPDTSCNEPAQKTTTTCFD